MKEYRTEFKTTTTLTQVQTCTSHNCLFHLFALSFHKNATNATKQAMLEEGKGTVHPRTGHEGPEGE
jgi:hypothetical protein